jgi:hypothetical protein
MPEFSVNFGNAKEFTKDDLPPEGKYTLKLVDYALAEPKKAESKGTGIVAALTFSVDELEEEMPKFRVKEWLWVDSENPWGAKPFYEAITGQELNEDMDISNPEEFVGERVGASLIHESYEKANEQTGWKMKIVDGSWFQV